MGGNPNSRRRCGITVTRKRPVCSISARLHAIGTRPDEAVFGPAAGPIFGADEAAIAEAIERLEYRRIVHFALVGLVAGGDRGDLHMTDNAEVLLEPAHEIAADDLRVIEIELDAQVRPLHLGDDVGSVLGASEEIVRPVARIDWFDQE